VYAELGDQVRAKEYWQRCLDLEPDVTVPKLKELFRLWNFPEPFTRKYFDSFSKAGVT
jgi:hypothetical protein